MTEVRMTEACTVARKHATSLETELALLVIVCH